MHVHGMCRLALVALARLESGQAKLRKTSKGCDTGSMLLVTVRKAITRRRPIIRPTRGKHWRCELLTIYGHIFMVSALLW